MHRTALFTALLITCLVSSLQAQPDTLWTRTYGGDLDDYFDIIIPTQDGNYFLAGHTSSYNTDESDIWVIMIDENGDEIWSQVFVNRYYEYSTDVIQTSDNGFAIAGISSTNDRNYYYLLKIDEHGEYQWARNYAGNYINECFSVSQLPDDGYVLTGYCCDQNWDGSCGYVVRTNENGETLWTTTTEQDGNFYCYTGTLDEQNNVIMPGYLVREDPSSCDLYLFKIDGEGNTIRSQRYPTNTWDLGNAVCNTGGGTWVIGGMNNTNNEADVLLTKVSENGGVIWRREFDLNQTMDWANRIIATPGGGFLIAGSTRGQQSDNLYVIKADNDGREQWHMYFGEQNRSICRSAVACTRGGYFLAGYKRLDGAGTYDGWLIKTAWDPVGIQEDAPEMPPTEFSLLPPYPNPFNSSTQIGYSVPVPGFVSISLFDISGIEVGNLFEGYKQTGTYHLILNEPLPSGNYFIKMEAENTVQTQTVTLIK